MQNSSHLGTNIVDSGYIHLHLNTDPVDSACAMWSVSAPVPQPVDTFYILLQDLVIEQEDSGKEEVWYLKQLVQQPAADCERLGL